MARLTVELATGGTPYELQSIANGTWGYISSGGLDDVPNARGENDIVAEASGRDPGAFIDDTRPITIHQTLDGSGATASARRSSYRTRMDNLKAQLGSVGTLVKIVAYPPNESLSTGHSATIIAQFQRITGPVSNGEQREFDIEFECIDSPPEWTVA